MKNDEEDEEEEEDTITVSVDWYTCRICRRNFSDKNLLRSHRQRKHGKVVQRRKRLCNNNKNNNKQKEEEDDKSVRISETIHEANVNDGIPIPSLLPSTSWLSPPHHSDDEEIEIIYETNNNCPPKIARVMPTQKSFEIIELDDDDDKAENNLHKLSPSLSNCDEPILEENTNIILVANEQQSVQKDEDDGVLEALLEKVQNNGQSVLAPQSSSEVEEEEEEKKKKKEMKKRQKKARRRIRRKIKKLKKKIKILTNMKSAHCCQSCERKFSSAISLADHIRFLHTTTRTTTTTTTTTTVAMKPCASFCCKKCDQNFSTCVQLLRHKSKVHSSFSASSTFSHKKFRKRVGCTASTPINLETFVEQKLSESTEIEWIGEQVEYQFSKNGVMSCMCKICKKEFIRIYETIVHIESSHDDSRKNDPNYSQDDDDDDSVIIIDDEDHDHHHDQMGNNNLEPLKYNKMNDQNTKNVHFSPGHGQSPPVKIKKILNEFITTQIFNEKTVYVCRICCKVTSYFPLALNHARIHEKANNNKGSKTDGHQIINEEKSTTPTTTTTTTTPPPLLVLPPISTEAAILKTKNTTTTTTPPKNHRPMKKDPLSYKASQHHPYISVRLHDDEEESKKKTFSCNYCKATFGQLSKALSHIILHTGERPFECTICHQKFVRGNSLKRHELRKNHKVTRPVTTSTSSRPGRRGRSRRTIMGL